MIKCNQSVNMGCSQTDMVKLCNSSVNTGFPRTGDHSPI